MNAPRTHRVLLLALAGGMLLVASGCTIGKSPDGQVGILIPLGTAIETANEALAAGAKIAGNFLFPGAGEIFAGIAGVLGLGWARTATRAATLDGKERGWSEAVDYHREPPKTGTGNGSPTVNPPASGGQPAGGGPGQG